MRMSLNEADRQLIVGGGVVRIMCEPIRKSYGHKRHHAAKSGAGPSFGEGTQAPIWLRGHAGGWHMGALPPGVSQAKGGDFSLR